MEDEVTPPYIDVPLGDLRNLDPPVPLEEVMARVKLIKNTPKATPAARHIAKIMLEADQLETDRLQTEVEIEAEEGLHANPRSAKELTPMQQAFCRYRVDGMNMKEAMIRSGLSATTASINLSKTGSDLEKRPYIIRYQQKLAIARALQEKKNPKPEIPVDKHGSLRLDKEWVLRELIRIKEKSEDADNFTQANAALKQISNLMGLENPNAKAKLKEPNKGETQRNVDTQKETKLSQFNFYVSDGQPDAGAGDQARDITPTHEHGSALLTDGRDDGPNRGLSLLDQLSRASATGVPITTEE